MPLIVDENVGPCVPNPAPNTAVKVSLGPQMEVDVDRCTRIHSLLPTLQMVIPLMSPVTLHLKVKVPPGQVGEAALNCPLTSPGDHLTNLVSVLLSCPEPRNEKGRHLMNAFANYGKI